MSVAYPSVVSSNRNVTPLNVALCGDGLRIAFARAIDEMQHLADQYGFVLKRSPSPELFLKTDAEALSQTDLIVVLQEYPGQYHQVTFDEFRRNSPLIRIVLLLDSLCRGELRTGFPIGGCRRFYMDEWNRLGREYFSAFIRGEEGFFTLPITCDDADIVQSLTRPGSASVPLFAAMNGDAFIVCEADVELGRFFAELCRKRGVQSRLGTFDDLFRSPVSPENIIIDSIDLSDRDFFEKVVRVSQQYSSSLISVLSFGANGAEIFEYESLPNCHIYGKPF